MRLGQALDQRITESSEVFRVGQVSAIVGAKLAVVTSGGASLIVPRLTSWTPTVGDLVVMALTPAGWIALGKIATS